MPKFHFLIEAAYKNSKDDKKNEPQEVFTQHFWMTYPSKEAALKVIEGLVEQEQAQLVQVECEEDVDVENLPEEIRRNMKDPEQEGIWFLGEKATY